jgi:transcriptional regulator with PAS, ATPase and Fis domain
MFTEGYNQFWKTVIDTMTDGLMVVDLQGTIISVNRAMEEITGYRRAELVGQPCSIIKCDTCFGSLIPGPGKHCDLFKKG